MPRFAKETSVSRNKTKDEIEKLLMSYGARTIFMNDTNEQNVLFVAWKIEGKSYKFELPLPAPDDKQFTHYESRSGRRSKEKAHALWEGAIRQYWRIGKNYIYMLMEMMEACGMEFHEAFAPLLALHNGSNVWMTAATNAKEISHSGSLMALMPPETS